MMCALPSQASTAVQQRNGPPSGVGDVRYPMFDRTQGQRLAWVEEIRLDPEEFCLAQRFKSAPYAHVGPAMIGNIGTADRINNFSDKERGKTLEIS